MLNDFKANKGSSSKKRSNTMPKRPTIDELSVRKQRTDSFTNRHIDTFGKNFVLGNSLNQ